jgi:hypothetical protein
MRARIHAATHESCRDAGARYGLGNDWMAAIISRCGVAIRRIQQIDTPDRQAMGRDTSTVVSVPDWWADLPNTPDQILRWYLSEYDRGTGEAPYRGHHENNADGTTTLVLVGNWEEEK